MTQGDRTRGTIASVDKAVRVLERLAEPASTGVTLGDLANDLGLNKSSLHHMLTTLRARAWVSQAPDGRYLLGPASAAIARWWSSPDQVTNLLRPALETVGASSHETVHLGTISGTSIVYLDKLEPDRAVRVVSKVGRMVPAAVTAMGRAVLGAREMDEAEVQTFIDAVSDPRPDLPERLQRERERVRTNGYAIEVEENEIGIACAAVPILLHDQVTAAISVTMPVERCSPERLRVLASEITHAVDGLDNPDIRPYPPTL